MRPIFGEDFNGGLVSPGERRHTLVDSQVASSAALSPPPTTTRGLFLQVDWESDAVPVQA